jgi:hypothetical protein
VISSTIARGRRNAIPQHLEPEEHRQPRPSQRGSTKLGLVDEVVEEKRHVVKEHQRRRRVAHPTCRCGDCGERTTAPSLPAPYERSQDHLCVARVVHLPEVLAALSCS